MPSQTETPRLLIDLSRQRLTLLAGERPICDYSVSTGANGAGELQGSGCTPRGLHRVRIKIGAGRPPNTIFVGRRPTGEIYTPEMGSEYPDRDWILTRILWLTGCQPGYNRGGLRDTLRRFIYIHGCPDSEPMGEARSHGCIRMRNADLLHLFELTCNGMQVEIREGRGA